ncbi:hypothetical protein TWF718_003420 [Orbilia javanica]|uniref:Uncharacterized protein n=1 Tax=Orbilia javanica TaxID=47235 RepID=A0AAN8MES7_9PEZI
MGHNLGSKCSRLWESYFAFPEENARGASAQLALNRADLVNGDTKRSPFRRVGTHPSATSKYFGSQNTDV